MLLMGTHVDDTMLCTNYRKLQDALMAHIRKHFPVQDYEAISHFLGIGFSQNTDTGEVVLEQRGAAEALLQELGLEHACHKKVPLPPGVKVLPHDGFCTETFRKDCQSKVAKAIYLQRCNPSISQAVSKLSLLLQAIPAKNTCDCS